MKNFKHIAVSALTLGLSLVSFSLAQTAPSIYEDKTVFVEHESGESEAQTANRYLSQALISKDQAVGIAQQALFKFAAPDSVTLGLEREGEQYYLVWKVVFGEFIARVNAGTGYALTGYVDNTD